MSSKVKLEELLADEKVDSRCKKMVQKQGFKETSCNEQLVFDLMQNVYFCPSCDLPYQYSSKINVAVPMNINARHLVELDKNTLFRILMLRENKFNYIYNEFQEASRTNRKADFFLQQLKVAKQYIARLENGFIGRPNVEFLLNYLKPYRDYYCYTSVSGNGIETRFRLKPIKNFLSMLRLNDWNLKKMKLYKLGDDMKGNETDDEEFL